MRVLLDISRFAFRVAFPERGRTVVREFELPKAISEVSLGRVERQLREISLPRGSEIVLLLPDSEFVLGSSDIPDIKDISYSALKVSLSKILGVDVSKLFLHYTKGLGTLMAMGIDSVKVKREIGYLKGFGLKLKAVLPKSLAFISALEPNPNTPENLYLLIDREGLYLSSFLKGFPLFSSFLAYPAEAFQGLPGSGADPVVLKVQMELSRYLRSFSVNYRVKVSHIKAVSLVPLREHPMLERVLNSLEIPTTFIDCSAEREMCGAYDKLLKQKSFRFCFTYNQLFEEERDRFHSMLRKTGLLVLILLAVLVNFLLGSSFKKKTRSMEMEIARLNSEYDKLYKSIYMPHMPKLRIYDLVREVSREMPEMTYVEELEFEDNVLKLKLFTTDYSNISELSSNLLEVDTELYKVLSKRVIKGISAQTREVGEATVDGYTFWLEIPDVRG